MSSKENIAELAQSSVAYSESKLYSHNSFARYNPDDLMSRKGYYIYKQMMNDDQLKAVVRFRRDAISGREWGFEFDDDVELSDEEKAKRITLFTKAIKNIKGNFKDRLNMLLSSIQNGFSITEPVYELFSFKNKQYWGIKDIVKKPFETFYFNTNEYGELDEVYQYMDGEKLTLDIDRLIHHVQNADEDMFYGKSEIREAYTAWFSKQAIIKFFNIHLERHASGFIWIAEKEEDSMPNAGSPDHEALANIINNFQVKTGILLPKGLEAHLEKPNNTDAFEKAIQMHDKAIAKALLMPNLIGFSEDGGVGSQARAQTQLEAFLWILDAEAISVEETLNEQLFKKLGIANFSDGIYPNFKFRPLSKAMLEKIVTTWGDLVSKNAVVPSRDDENHIRNLMDFPSKPEEDDSEENSEAVDSQTALNGAQVTAMADIVEKVSTGLMPWSTGVAILVSSFPLSKDKAESLLEDVPKDLYNPQDKGVSEDDDGIEDDGIEDDGIEDDGIEDDGIEDDGIEDDGIEDEDEDEDETLLGTPIKIVHTHKFTSQIKRVNFSEIDRSSQVIVSESVSKLASTVNDLTQFFVKEIEIKELSGEGTDPEAVNDISVPASFKKKMQKASAEMLRYSWELGGVQGKQEIEKAGNEFTKKQKLKDFKAKFGSITDIATAYFETRSFEMAGKLSEATLTIIKQEILNGIKYSKPHSEIVKSIYTQLASFGYLDMEDVEDVLGQALEITNPTARLETTVRTSSFEAINEARFSYFTDPELDGFVKALEYTAILDSRTTDICTDMDERKYAADSSEWDRYRPPNHFNCRSLLIPLVEGDVYTLSTDPHNVEPANGFS